MLPSVKLLHGNLIRIFTYDIKRVFFIVITHPGFILLMPEKNHNIKK